MLHTTKNPILKLIVITRKSAIKAQLNTLKDCVVVLNDMETQHLQRLIPEKNLISMEVISQIISDKKMIKESIIRQLRGMLTGFIDIAAPKVIIQR